MTTARPKRPPAIRIRGIDHAVLRAKSMRRMVDFYVRVLGCTLERNRADLGLVQLRAGRSLIDLVDVKGRLGRLGGRAPQREGRNLDHLALRVTKFDAEALRRHLARRGVKMGEVAERYGAEGEGPSVYIADPEGNTIELKGPARRMKPRRVR